MQYMLRLFFSHFYIRTISSQWTVVVEHIEAAASPLVFGPHFLFPLTNVRLGRLALRKHAEDNHS